MPAAEASIPADGPPHLVAFPDIAAMLGIIVTKVHQMVKDRVIVAVRVDGIPRVPAEFIDRSTSNGIVKGLTGTITLLTDAGFTDAEIIDWLFTADSSLPGRPITALQENRGREVHRRAQAAGF